MKQPLFVDQKLLDSVSTSAASSARKRKNYNFHEADQALSHRLLNAVEPDSYIAPHRHLDSEKDETMVALRGKIGIVFFDESGQVTGTVQLEPNGAVVAVNIPYGTYHSLVALEPGCVFFESKAGPYEPLTPDEKATWAPSENASEAAAYLAKMRALFA